MSIVSLEKAVYDKFTAEWTETPEAEIDFGSNGSHTPKDETPWCRIVVNVVDTENAEVGTGFQRNTGYIVVQCFTPIKSGGLKASQMADAVQSIFQNSDFSGVKTYATTSRDVGQSGNWFQKNSQTRFTYDVFS